MRAFFFGTLVLLAGYGLFSGVTWKLNDGFELRHIQSDLSYSSAREIKCHNEMAIRTLLNQNFYYMGKGSQMYVFESEDHDIVLKFFRHPRYRLHRLTSYITAPAFLTTIQKTKRDEKQHKLDALFTSCKLAYQELREETQLLYVHLNKTNHLRQTVVLHDKLKRTIPIEIDQYEFVIQKKGEQIFPYLTRLLEQGKKQEAKEALAHLVSILGKRTQRGIKDSDAVIHKNSGFRHGRALFLDVGSFERAPLFHSEPLSNQTRRLQSWLTSHDPELATFFEQTLRNGTAASKAPPDIFKKSSLLMESFQNTQPTQNR